MTKNGIEEHRADSGVEHPATKQSVAKENSVMTAMTEDGSKEHSADPITEEYPTDDDTHAADEPAAAEQSAVAEEDKPARTA